MNKPRGIWITGNWKMNMQKHETEKFFSTIKNSQDVPPSIHVVLFAPALSLETSIRMTKGTHIEIGAQNAHWQTSGAFTGEISGPMLTEIGISNVLVAHSERRQYFGETDQTAGRRIEALASQGFQIIFCLGETKAERDAGETEKVIDRQFREALKGPEAKKALLDGKLLIAYEPVWAIGTGVNASPDQAEEVHKQIRTLLWDTFGMDTSAKTPVLYGGSVTPQNFGELMACPNIDGVLVGGASLKPESFQSLIDQAKKVNRG